MLEKEELQITMNELLQARKILHNRIADDERMLGAIDKAQETIKKLRQSELPFWKKRLIEQRKYLDKLHREDRTEQKEIHYKSALEVKMYIELQIQNIEL